MELFNRLMRTWFGGLLFIGIFFSSCQYRKTVDPASVNSDEKVQQYLLRGWNTWNNSDLLNCVFLPDGLSIKIGFKETYIYRPSVFLNRLTIDNPGMDAKVRFMPVAHSTDGRYIDYYISWDEFEARIQISRERRDIVILYTPVKLPDHPPVIFMEVGMLWNKNAKMERNGKYIQAGVGPNIFSVGATKNTDNIPLPLPSLYLSFNSGEEIGFFSGEVRTLENIKKYISERKIVYEETQNIFGNLSEAFHVNQSALAWNTIYDPFNHRTITPVSRDMAEKAGGWILFNAESYLTAVMYSASYKNENNWIDKFNSYSNAIAVTKSIVKEGFIPAYTGPYPTGSSMDHSSAPIGSLMCNLIYKKYNEKWFLEEVYEELLIWNRWWDKYRNNKGYLSWGSETLGEMVNTKEAAIAESDLNGTNYFTDISYSKENHKLEIASVELISLYIADCNALAEIAEILNKEDGKAELLQRAKKYAAKLDDLWDDKTGIYRDKDLLSNQFCSILPATSFYSLLSGVPDRQKAERMIYEHLLNPEEFFGDYMIPLFAWNSFIPVDSTDAGFYILPKLNFLVSLGLKNYDFPETSKILSDKSLNLLMKEWGKNKRIYSKYNSISGMGSDIPDNDSFYTTGGLLALIALMEEKYW